MPPKKMNEGIPLEKIAALIGGELIGNGTTRAFGICSLDEPAATFLAFSRAKFSQKIMAVLEHTPLAALLVSRTVTFKAPPSVGNLILVEDPLLAIARLIPHFYDPPARHHGISPLAAIDPSAIIGKDVAIGPFCSIGPQVEIGDSSVIYPQVTIYAGAKIGHHVVIHAGAIVREECVIGAHATIQNGAIIGSDGFGYALDTQQGLIPIPQVGNVVLAERVDIGANSCVDRATLGNTTIGNSSKIDNLVQIGHNVTIGELSILCGQAGVAGSSHVGNGVVVGGQAGIADHLTIADGVRIGAHSGVAGDLLEKDDYAGTPAIPAAQWRRSSATFASINKKIKELKSRVS